MAILQNRRTVFTLANTEVMSNSAPTTEAGIVKSEGHDGFFIYSDKPFTLWFKDQGGSWSLFNTYEIIDLTDGVAFSWNTNTAAFVQTNEVSHSIAAFIIETKEVGNFGNLENTTVSSAGLGRLEIHSNYKKIRMQNSGHTGEAYAIAVFDENGEASYISAPPSGEREGKVLGWDENGSLGWISLTSEIDATLYGDTTLTNGVLSFDGDGDYAIYNGDFAFTDQFSVSAWFKISPSTDGQIFSCHYAGHTNKNGFFAYMLSSGTLRLRYPDGGTGLAGTVELSSGLNDGQWHHLTMTWDASTTNGKKAYLDGVEIYSANTTTGAYHPNAQLYIGAGYHGVQNSVQWFGNSDVKGFEILNSVLTAQQIATSYAADAPVSVPFLYLDGSSATPQIGDASDVVNLGSAALVTNNGKYDSTSFDFGTSGNKAPIRLNNLDLSTGIYSVSLWFYNKRSGNDFGSILRQSGTGPNSAYYPAGTHQTTNELGLHLGAASNTSPDYGFRSTGYDMTSFEGLQEWSHLVVVADGTNTTFYINGQQAGDVVPHVVATHLREVGAYDGNDTQVFAQGLDDFAYWGTALTAAQVTEIYNSSDKLGDIV